MISDGAARMGDRILVSGNQLVRIYFRIIVVFYRILIGQPFFHVYHNHSPQSGLLSFIGSFAPPDYPELAQKNCTSLKMILDFSTNQKNHANCHEKVYNFYNCRWSSTMNFFKQNFNLFLLGLLYFGTFTAPAQAYIDPGTGNFIIQMLVAGIAGSLFLLKTYWQKLKNWITGRGTDDTAASSSKEQPTKASTDASDSGDTEIK
jgi:hypothetical protein